MNVLSIGGSDPSSGAGIQSDIKTFENHGVYGLTVITAITSQNTKKISKILPISANIINVLDARWQPHRFWQDLVKWEWRENNNVVDFCKLYNG